MVVEYVEFMYTKPTHHWPGVPSTMIDHITTNQPANIDNDFVKPTHISDYELTKDDKDKELQLNDKAKSDGSHHGRQRSECRIRYKGCVLEMCLINQRIQQNY